MKKIIEFNNKKYNIEIKDENIINNKDLNILLKDIINLIRKFIHKRYQLKISLLSKEDIMQELFIITLKSIKNFDINRKCKFDHYLKRAYTTWFLRLYRDNKLGTIKKYANNTCLEKATSDAQRAQIKRRQREILDYLNLAKALSIEDEIVLYGSKETPINVKNTIHLSYNMDIDSMFDDELYD